MDTQRQNFWKESVKKEAYVRLAWHNKYQKNVEPRDAVTSEDRRLARSKKITGKVPVIPKTILPVITYPKKQQRNVAIIRKSSNADEKGADVMLVEMRPVSPNVKKLLYNGFTKEEKGRYQYLRARTSKKPEDKYGYPLTSSWEYGWRLNDVVKEFHSPQYGRSRIVRDSFFRNNGIFYRPLTTQF